MLSPCQCREGRSPDHMQEAPGHMPQTSVKSAVLPLPCCQPRRHLTFSTPTSERVPLDSSATVLGPGLFVFIHPQTTSPGLTSQRRKLAQRGGETWPRWHAQAQEDDSDPGLLGATLVASLESVPCPLSHSTTPRPPTMLQSCRMAEAGRALPSGPGNGPKFLPFNNLGL